MEEKQVVYTFDQIQKMFKHNLEISLDMATKSKGLSIIPLAYAMGVEAPSIGKVNSVKIDKEKSTVTFMYSIDMHAARKLFGLNTLLLSNAYDGCSKPTAYLTA